MQVTAEVDPHDVASEMVQDGSFAMDVLAALADNPERALKAISDYGIGCEWHETVPDFLRKLADAIKPA